MKRLKAQEIFYNQKWMMNHAYGYWYMLASNRLKRAFNKAEFCLGSLPTLHWCRQRQVEVEHLLKSTRNVYHGFKWPKKGGE